MSLLPDSKASTADSLNELFDLRNDDTTKCNTRQTLLEFILRWTLVVMISSHKVLWGSRIHHYQTAVLLGPYGLYKSSQDQFTVFAPLTFLVAEVILRHKLLKCSQNVMEFIQIHSIILLIHTERFRATSNSYSFHEGMWLNGDILGHIDSNGVISGRSYNLI